MDAEEAHQLLTEVQLCCLISEAEKRGRGHKAKYRNILATLADEDGSGATQPEASQRSSCGQECFGTSHVASC
jgi:hypothetical protein